MINYIFNRLKEPSTFAGLGLIGTVAPQIANVIHGATNPASLAIGLIGLLAVLLKEGEANA